MSPTKAARPLAPALSVWMAIRPRPSTRVKASLKLVCTSNRGAATSNLLSGQLKRSSVTGPSACGRRATTDTARCACRCSAAQRPGTICGLAIAAVPRNPPLNRPEPTSATPTGPNGVASAMLLSATSSTKFGSANGLLVGGGRSRSIWPQLTLPWISRPRSRTPRAKTRYTSKLPSHLSRIWIIACFATRSGRLGSPMTRS